MWELLLQDVFIEGFIRSVVIFLSMLGVVYIFGRMLELVKTNRGRNAIAIITSFPISYWTVIMYDINRLQHPLEIWWRTFIYAIGACILFVLVGWKLFDRVDNLLDKKVAPDDENDKHKNTTK